MSEKVYVPALGESITEATVTRWLKAEGDAVAMDESLVELETDKVSLEIPSPVAGVLVSVQAAEGAQVEIGAVLCEVKAGAGAGAGAGKTGAGAGAEKAAPIAPPTAEAAVPVAPVAPVVSPAARRVVEERGLDAQKIKGSGRGGVVLKEDAMAVSAGAGGAGAQGGEGGEGVEEVERVPMTRLRQTIAKRLKEAQNTAAMLTTFNDVDMSGIMEMRKRYGAAFEKRYGVRLGFMGFFVKACVGALQEVPQVNARIDGDDILYHKACHIAVAVGGGKGLVTPVLRDAHRLSVAQIEQRIGEISKRAQEGKITLEELQGGTFTISNGGVYGSLLSTPILNPPQSGILGMHRIEEKPVVRSSEVVVRPMMYVALSYDHRLVDGREAVTFLVRVKQGLEDPARLVLEI